MSILLPLDHHNLISADDIREICNIFFEQTGIIAFVYARIFDHGQMYALCTNAAWSLYHFNMRSSPMPSIPKNIINSRFIFTMNPQAISPESSKILQEYRSLLGLDYPYFSFERYHNYYDLYGFCTAVDNHDITHFYLNQSHYIEKFKRYFKNKSKNLIKDASRHRLIVPNNVHFSIDWNAPHKIYSDFHQAYSFTPKEVECIRYLCLGHSMKSTAKMMNISPKTVEFHLNNIKYKTQTTTKSELLVLLNGRN